MCDWRLGHAQFQETPQSVVTLPVIEYEEGERAESEDIPGLT